MGLYGSGKGKGKGNGNGNGGDGGMFDSFDIHIGPFLSYFCYETPKLWFYILRHGFCKVMVFSMTYHSV